MWNGKEFDCEAEWKSNMKFNVKLNVKLKEIECKIE